MRKALFTLSVFSTLFSLGQSAIKNTSVVSMCGCPGEVWNFNTPFQPASSFQTIDHTKRLMHTNYDFNIPATATIQGIAVDFDYSTSNAPNNTIRDSNACLLFNGGMTANDKSPLTPFYNGSGHITLGGYMNNWALLPSPADINSPGFGFNIRFYSPAMGPSISLTNGVSMTVWYMNASGLSESQRSSPGMKAYVNGKFLFLENTSGEKSEVEIYDLTGKCIQKNFFEGGVKNMSDISSLKEGVYVYRYKTTTSSKTARIVVE